MAPYEIKNMTLKKLRKAFLAMMSPKWDMALEGKPKTEVTKAAKLLLALQRTRLRLGNKKLSKIRNELKKKEKALIEGTENLDKALERLDDVEDVLTGVDGLLRIVGAIIGFIS